jgi:uridine kinase
MRYVEINVLNTGELREFPIGTTLQEIAVKMNIQLINPILGAYVNNRVKPLDYEIVKPRQIRFFDYSNNDGQRMYIRTLSFVLYSAIKNLWPEAGLKIDHAISRGYYCEIEGKEKNFTDDDLLLLKEEMGLILKRNLPVERKIIFSESAIELYDKEGLTSKALLFNEYGRLYAPICKLNGHVNFFYGHMLISSGCITNFGIERYYEGLLLRFPVPSDMNLLEPATGQDKLFGIFREHKNWAEILGVRDIAQLNRITHAKKYGNIIKVSEALHEKKIVDITARISEKRDKINMILIAGPSSSGKTTFSRRLGIQLAVVGLHSIEISIDDFFKDRQYTPLDENGEYDFESLDAIDVPFFNDFLLKLMNGEEVFMPRFDFHLGRRVITEKKIRMQKDNILIIEGIHGLNPALTPQIDPEKTFRIFVSALTQISIDEHTYIPTTDNRLLRRIVRDSKYRGYDARTTIQRWPSVRRGEEKHIFTYQENADVMFNSALIYELAVLKKYADPLLKQVKENAPEYSEAVRLLIFISYFEPIPDEEIPPTSVLREFLGGSSFEY